MSKRQELRDLRERKRFEEQNKRNTYAMFGSIMSPEAKAWNEAHDNIQMEYYDREIARLEPLAQKELEDEITANILKNIEKGISMTINTQISQNARVTESDLCVLLSNILENALNACYKMKDSNLEATIDLSAFERNSTLFIQVSNDYNQDITFVEGVPVTKEMNHGIGVRSICALVERYEGMYSFELKDGKFVLRVAL